MTLIIGLTWFSAGLALGSIYLFLIGRTVVAITGDNGWTAAALPLVLRISLAVAAFAVASGQGALPVLAMLAGFLVARSLGLRRVREE